MGRLRGVISLCGRSLALISSLSLCPSEIGKLNGISSVAFGLECFFQIIKPDDINVNSIAPIKVFDGIYLGNHFLSHTCVQLSCALFHTNLLLDSRLLVHANFDDTHKQAPCQLRVTVRCSRHIPSRTYST
jgi:hypothetical protein